MPLSSAPDPAALDTSPTLAVVTRGPLVESRHRGIAVVADASGAIVAQWGDAARPVYPRSAVKALQAVPIIASGAADAFALDDWELALACASHNGEPAHTERVERWLTRIGCSAADLECGSQEPTDKASADALIRDNRKPSALHNNCSGKHAGFLSTARHLGEPTQGYVKADHPVQQRVRAVLEEMSGKDLSVAPCGIDGCSIPTYAIALNGVATAMARIADPVSLSERRRDAVMRLRHAWGAQPYMVAGRNRFDTEVMEATRGAVLVKTGAEGVHCACLPALGLGVALKIDDGAGRAAEVAMLALLSHLGAIDALALAPLAPFADPVLTNRRGIEVGFVQPSDGFPA